MDRFIERIRGFRMPSGSGPAALLIVSALALATVLWGIFFANPDITVVQFDAGPVDAVPLEQASFAQSPNLILSLVSLCFHINLQLSEAGQ